MKPIFLVGYMGSGKTTFGKLIANQLHRPFVDLDQQIETEQQMTVAQLFAERGEAAFRELERETLRRTPDEAVVATGGGTPCFFDNMKQMNARGLTVYFDLTPQELLNHLRHARTERPLIKNKTDEELLRLIPEMLRTREPFYAQATLRANPCREPLEAIVLKLNGLL